MPLKKTEFISVWLDNNDKILRSFRCVNCGKIVFEYYGSVKLIVGGQNQVSSPHIIQCKGTIEKYDFSHEKYTERCHTKFIVC